MNVFGKYISQKRTEQAITQKELAEKLHVSSSAISKWERGLALPHVSDFPNVAAALNVPVEELYALTNTEDLNSSIHAVSQSAVLEDMYLDNGELPGNDIFATPDIEDTVLPDANIKSRHKNKIVLFILITIALFIALIFIVIGIRDVSNSGEPVLRVAEEYFSTDQPYFDYTNIYYVHIEYDGSLTEEFLQEYKAALSTTYLSAFDKAELVIVSFYDDYSATVSPEFKWVLLPDKKGK